MDEASEKLSHCIRERERVLKYNNTDDGDDDDGGGDKTVYSAII